MLFLRLFLLPFLLLPLSAGADTEPMRSDWLELVKGYKGSSMGAELVSIEEGYSSEMQRVTVAIPKSAVGDLSEIEEVLVVGRAPEKPRPLNFTYEWADDYDNENYGLIIHLRKDSAWPIRVYLNAEPGFLNR